MKHALITGGTRGIGRACAERFAAAGWRVTVVARLHDVPPEETEGIDYFAADLASVRGVHSVPRGPYDLVVLNAGNYRPGQLTDAGPDVFTALLPLNVVGNHRLARRLLPPMKERGSGHLLVIGSSGTDEFADHMTAYVATKYALRGLFLGWERELAGSGVRATLLAPGATLTSSWDGQEPPPGILEPATVAERAYLIVEEAETGRVTM